MFVRSLGQDWRSQYLLSLLLELNTTWPQKESPSSSTPLPSALPTPNPASTATLNKFSTVLQHIVDLDLLEAPSIKPILNGKEMLVLLEQRRPGPWMTNALARVVEWQLDHSEEGKEAAEEWVKSMKEELVRV